MHLLNNRLGRVTALLAIGGSVLVAQGVQTGDMAGVVTSKDGAPIAGALVRLEGGRGVRTTTTNAKGEYRFALLIVGPCKITATAPNFLGASADATVNLGKTNKVDFSLKATSNAAATVEVIAATAVEATAVTDGKNTNLEFVDSLPINNRTIQNIASLTPGTSNDGTGLTIRGAQGTQTQWLVDGVDVMDPVTGGFGIFMNEDMIQEIQVVTGGATADMGRFTGGMVNTVTKSGTNEFEGSARWELTNPKWNALRPMEKAPVNPGTAIVQNYRFSGPIIKDKLFFVVGYRNISPKGSVVGYTTAPRAFGGQNQYFATTTDERKDIKLDYQINTDHRVSYIYNEAKRNRTGIDYSNAFFGGSTSVATLSAQPDKFSYQSLAYTGSLTNNLLLSFHYGNKNEELGGPGGGGQGGFAPVMVDQDTQYVYDNGIFGNDGDKRPVKNATLSATWFTSSPFGEHELKVGSDWFQSSRNSSNSQSPNNQYIFFNGWTVDPASGGSLDLSNRVFAPGTSYLQQWVPFTGAETKNTVTSLYVNDKVKFNKYFSANVGLRYDKFKSENDIKASNFDVSALAPRLTGIYDVLGDGQWVVEASYDEYAGQIIQGATDGASVVGNPAVYQYYYVGGPGNLRSSYAANPYLVYDPGLYRKSNLINPNLKSPMTVEKTIAVRHNDNQGGSYSLTVSKRDWKNFVTTFTSLQPNPVDANDLALSYITNDPSLERHYLGIEFQWQKQITREFSFGGNLTWSETKGNFEGGQVGTSSPINAFGAFGAFSPVNVPNAAHNLAGYNLANGLPGSAGAANAYQPTRDQLSPYGYLASDRPVIIQMWSNYTKDVFGNKGRVNLGLFANYSSGAPYANTVTQALTNYPDTPSGAFGSNYIRFFTPRGAMRFPDQYNVSFQAGYEHKVWKKAALFGRLNITNLFNHQLQTSWNTVGSSYYAATAADPYYSPTSLTATARTNGYQPDIYNRPNAIFIGGSNYGKPTGVGNFLAARGLNFAFGVRF